MSTKKIFKKKNKTQYLERDASHTEHDGIRGLDKKVEDPDVLPYVLETGGKQYEGKVEGSQSSHYVLFCMRDDGFDVIPADKWYKFNRELFEVLIE